MCIYIYVTYVGSLIHHTAKDPCPQIKHACSDYGNMCNVLNNVTIAVFPVKGLEVALHEFLSSGGGLSGIDEASNCCFFRK